MDKNWIKYNMRRVQVGLDAWVNPEEFSAMQEELDKSIGARLEPHMVKLTGYDGNGMAQLTGSGFLYTMQAPLIVTCDHLRTFKDSAGQQQPVTKFTARYASDGTEEDVTVVTQPSEHIDVMVLSGKRPAGKDLLAGSPGLGSTVYTIGFAPESPTLSFDRGMITSTRLGLFALSAHADNGWSGGPVVNRQAQVVGIIKHGVGETIKQPEAISVDLVHQFLLTRGQPGFRA